MKKLRKAKKWWQEKPAAKLLLQISSLVAPARCIVCLAEDTWLCSTCSIKPIPIKPRKIPKPLINIISLGAYSTSSLRRGIDWLKFKGIKKIAPIFSEMLAIKLSRIAPMDELMSQAVLIPIPLHKRRQAQRGFNQAELIARELSKQTEIVTENLLSRNKATLPQSKLLNKHRAANVKDAFSLTAKNPVPRADRTIALLVDDVATSGATLAAAAKELKPYQFKQIWGVTIARG